MADVLHLWREIPSTSTLLACVGVGLVIVLAARQIFLWHRLSHIPGPKFAGWSVGWQLYGAMGGRYHEKLREAADTYGKLSHTQQMLRRVSDANRTPGPLVRIGPNELLCTDPDVLRRMSGVRSHYTKGKFYSSGQITPGVDNVVSTRDEEKHKAMRARMWAGVSFYDTNSNTISLTTHFQYSGKEHEGGNFESGMDRQIMAFMNLLERKYISTAHETRPFDLAEKTQFFALDAIGDISMGAPFGYMTTDEDLYNYNEINASSLPVMNLVSVLPWLTKIVHQWPLRLAMPKEGDAVGFGRLIG